MNYTTEGCKIKNFLEVNELITISKQQFSNRYFFRGESHNFYEAVCVLSGTVGITAGKKVFVLSAGQMTIHPPKEFHAILEHNDSRPICIIFSFSAAAFPTIKSHIYTVNENALKDISRIYDSSKHIFEIETTSVTPASEFSGTTEFEHGLVVSGIKENMQYSACKFGKELELFLMSVLEVNQDKQMQNFDSSSESYAKILDIMEAHTDDRLCMTELAQLCGMSSPMIEKIMYKYLRCGAMAYYNNIRMEKAHHLLSHGISVKNVASTLNFATQSYFSLSFKKHFGYPPSEIKKQS